MMRLVFAYAALTVVFILACSDSEPLANNGDILDAIAIQDGCDCGDDVVGVVDTESNDVLAGDTTVYADVLPTCLTYSWQCLSDDDCPEYSECLGTGSCAEPPCTVYCDNYPGVCLPKVMGVCEAEDSCASGSACVSSIGTLGYCRGGPESITCYNDDDCAVDHVCAGESVCEPGHTCLLPEMFGKCVPAISEGCWDDADCPDGHCEGVVLCPLDPEDCIDDVPGTCVAGSRIECTGDENCAASTTGKHCIIIDKNQPGFCGPVFGQALGKCWSSLDCSDGTTCRGAVPCPPGTFCALGERHAGICGEYPKPDETPFAVQVPEDGLSLVSPALVLHNISPVTVWVSTCYSVSLFSYSDEPKDIGYFNIGDDCDTGGGMVIGIASGSAIVLDSYVGDPSSRKATLRVDYRYCQGTGATHSCQDTKTFVSEVIQTL